MRAAAALFCAALAGACSSVTEPMSDWERRHPELIGTPQSAQLPAPPAMPRQENLIEFYVEPTATFRYFIDAASLSVFYKQQEVRYVGDASGKWSVRPSEWQAIQSRTSRGWPSVLARQFFCPHRDPIQSVAEGVNALRLGAHPLVYVEQRPGPASP